MQLAFPSHWRSWGCCASSRRSARGTWSPCSRCSLGRGAGVDVLRVISRLALAVVALLHLVARAGTWNRRLVLKGESAWRRWPHARIHRALAQNRASWSATRDCPRNKASADILTYFETGPTKLYHFSPTRPAAETSIFMGFVALALAGLAFGLRDGAETPPPPAGPGGSGGLCAPPSSAPPSSSRSPSWGRISTRWGALSAPLVLPGHLGTDPGPHRRRG